MFDVCPAYEDKSFPIDLDFLQFLFSSYEQDEQVREKWTGCGEQHDFI